MNIIIFTDLDGSLLNHDDYAFSEAWPVLKRIMNLGIPLIMTTSKTRREVESIQQTMAIREPFIVENGAAVYFPIGYRGLFVDNAVDGDFLKVVQLGISYGRIRSFMNDIKRRFKICGFGDLSVKEISDLTGLSIKQAEFAMFREFTEPFLLESDQDIEALRDLAADNGMKITQGGRFYHMIGIRQDKGEAVNAVREIFDREIGEKHMAIGIGDSANDLPMLNQTDIPVIIPHPDGTFLDVSLPKRVIAQHPGSRGWSETIDSILDKLNFHES